MNEKTKSYLVGIVSAVLGAMFGALCGSRSLLVVLSVAAVSSAIVAWVMQGMVK
jgi:hypothetical protein